LYKTQALGDSKLHLLNTDLAADLLLAIFRWRRKIRMQICLFCTWSKTSWICKNKQIDMA